MKRMLDAINIMLQTIGEQPLLTNEDLAASFEGTTAVSVLEEVKLEVLSEGLFCNTDSQWPFVPDVNGYIAIPSNVIRVDPVLDRLNYSIKSHLLYNKKDKTHKFTTPVLCDVVWELPFDDIPHSVQYYITIKAARKFQGRVVGDSTQYGFTERDEQQAKVQMVREESDTGDYSIFDSYAVTRVLDRSRNPMGIGGK